MKKDPRSFGARCTDCPFSKDGQPVTPVLGEGSERPLGILVGEHPSHEDSAAGRPLVGSTGIVLNEALADAGLVREQLFVVLATCCRPPVESRKDEKATRQAVECCRPALLGQLNNFDPETPVLSMGKWAQRALMKKGLNLGKGRGFIRWGWRIPHMEEESGTDSGEHEGEDGSAGAGPD